MFGFCPFGSDGELSGGSDFGNFVFEEGSFIKEMGATVDDPIEDPVAIGVREEPGFFFQTIVSKESEVSNSIDVDMPGQLEGGLSLEGVMASDVGGVGRVKVLGLVEGFIDG